MNVDVGLNVGVDAYATVAPGDPVESVDVFYDELSPYGVWVDEPGVGRVFIADDPSFVPYMRGHWQYTNLGFVWISTEPFAWATSHYGRWAYSNYYGRWYWLPDTEWGPAWVEWRQVGDDFGWAPLPPEIVVRTGWRPPVESWRYCSANHILDVNLTRYYEPRERVIELHRSARPIEHYATISNVKVVVGPPPATLRTHHVEVRPVRVEPRIVGRWTAGEARAQVERAREHRATFEVQNQRRIDSNPKIHTAHVKVVEAHPQIKAQVNARVQGRVEQREPEHGRVEPNRAEPQHAQPPRPEPNRAEPQHAQPQRPEPNRAEPQHTQPQRPEPNRAEPQHTQPQRPEPNRAEPQHAQPQRPEPPRAQPQRPEPPRAQPPRPETPRAQPQRPEPPRAEPQRPEPQRAQPPHPEPQRAQPPRPEPQRAEPQRAEPPHAQPQRPEPPRAEPPRAEPPRAEPPRAQPQRPEPPRAEPPRAEPPRAEPRAPERKEPERRQPDRKDSDRKDSDRKEPDRH